MKKVLSIFSDYYYYFYLFFLVAAVASIPYSRAILSTAEISLASLWVLSGDYKTKFRRIKDNKAVLLILIIFLLHLVGLIYTTDYHTALKDIKIKLPLLLFPIIIGTSKKLGMRELKLILIAFSLSLFIQALWGTLSYFHLTTTPIDDVQNISGKISHIRFSLMLNIAAFSMIYLLLFDKTKYLIFYRIFYAFLSAALILFIIIIHSVTGWVVLITLTLVSFIYFIYRSEKRILKFSATVILILTITGIVLFFFRALNKFNTSETVDFRNLETHTASGNTYDHDTLRTEKENGHYVNIYICEKEIKEEWNKVSTYTYGGKDKKGQFIKYTLVRYLSSKGYRKDKEGIQKLSPQDIQNIENGLTNHIFENQLAVYPKLYEIFWQVRRYRNGANPQGHSVTQRIEFIKNGISIIKRNFWFGTGTGDVKKAYKKQYDLSDTELSEAYQLRAHNQYITIFITFGFIGFLFFVFSWFYLPFITKKYKDYLFLITYILLTLSMLNEDTLETQMGATLFALFLNLFLFSEPMKTDEKDQ